MKANQATHSVRRMCRLLGVSPSGYYALLSRSTSTRVKTDRMLRDRIVEIHHRSRSTYGAPRVHAEFAAEGVQMGRKRVARLMQNANIEGVHRRRQPGRLRPIRRHRTARSGATSRCGRWGASPGPGAAAATRID